jgi:CRISPR-associated protein Cmr2
MQYEFVATLPWVQTALTAKNKVEDWKKWRNELTPPSELLRIFSFLPDPSAITIMPYLSFTLSIPFQLHSPYISKDERDFYLLDNPLRKEKVFQTPMVASTGWKGALRGSLWQLGYNEDHETVIRLLGNPRESEDQQAGRLYFFPTFFDQIGLEVINPHTRKTGVGDRGPILLECVPPKTKGELLILYVPFGAFDQDEGQVRVQVAQDLELLAQGVQAMLITYGFGAKTSSGFGTAEERLAGAGRLLIRAKLAGEAAPPPAAPPTQQQSALPRYLESPARLHSDFRRPDGGLKSEGEYQAFIESRGQTYAKKDKQLYEKAKGWWEREGRAMAEVASQEPEQKPNAPESPPIAEFTFNTLNELYDLARRSANQLREGYKE